MQEKISKNSFVLDLSASSASEKLMSMVFGFMVSQAISVIARLGIADLLQEGSRSAADLAETTNAHPHSLYRVMRALASKGIFHEHENKTFSLTPMGNLLKKNPLDGIGGFSAFFCSDWHWPVWGSLDYSVRSGEPAFEKVYSQSFFSYLEECPRASQIFNEGMTSFSAATGEAVLDAYDYSGIKRLIDVGGGHGYLLASIVRHYPEMTGILFDSPSVINGAQPILNACNTDSQFELVGGDFFEKIDVKGDAIIMKHILHDWDEKSCLKILRNCHAALPKNGKLLVVEMVIPGPNQPAIGKWLDLQMLVFLHSCERTEEEYAILFAKAGFKLTGVFPSMSPLSLIEAVRL